MPIKIPDSLPARATLESENIFVMTEYRAIHQDMRPLNLLLLNLMPTKIVTETQLLRKLSNSPLQVEVELLQMASHTSQNTDADHLSSFYTTFDKIKDRKFDGMIITGAPVENMAFEQVDYWPELGRILEFTKTSVYSTLHVCWGAQAALYYHYGIPKHSLPQKLFGVFAHEVIRPSNPLVRGFDEVFYAPHSRHTESDAAAIAACGALRLLAASPEAGPYLLSTENGRQIFITGHPEYDRFTLDAEYRRDLARGLPIAMPKNYYPADDPARPPLFSWRSHAYLLYTNWLNYYVYQSTPYDLDELAEL